MHLIYFEIGLIVTVYPKKASSRAQKEVDCYRLSQISEFTGTKRG